MLKLNLHITIWDSQHYLFNNYKFHTRLHLHLRTLSPEIYGNVYAVDEKNVLNKNCTRILVQR